MPKAGVYRANSVIYFQGDVSDKVFILQSGQVSLNYADIETGKEIREVIQKGEFFGVKSALGKYPREENALVLTDSQVLIFTEPEFERFAETNTRIIMKMLKVFSSQLRRVHQQVDNLLERDEGETVSPEMGLYRDGEYYLKNKQYSEAKYLFGRYLSYYPAGSLAEQASQYLETAETDLAKYGDGKGPAPIMAAPPPRMAGAAKTVPGLSAGAPLAASATVPAGSAQGPGAAPSTGKELSVTEKVYYDAVSLFSQGKYKEAFSGFKRIVAANEDPEYTSKALYDMGRSLYMLGQYDMAIKHCTQVIMTYPQHPDIADLLFYLGQSYEKKGDGGRAEGFYKKILSMESDEDSSVRIKAKRALRGLTGAANG